DLVQELREDAHFREFYTKQRAAKKYNTRVIPRKFMEGNLVLKRPMGREIKEERWQLIGKDSFGYMKPLKEEPIASKLWKAKSCREYGMSPT
ncbi:hypothetical protein A2U01_0073454, partial [Trifolium medium]|nr:hypothetical protein [Trifolium medium]